MIGFLVSINGTKSFLAGFGGDGSFSLFLEKPLASDQIEIEATGIEVLPNDLERFVRWNKVKIKEGDEIKISVIETEKADAPISEIFRTPQEKQQQTEVGLAALRASKRV